MASTNDWLDAGLEILATEGAPAITIERLTERLGLTKGSFYHHFKGMGGYKTGLLAHLEEVTTTRYIELTEQDPEAPPMVKLQRLRDLVVGMEREGPDLEVALRAWAQQDAEVRALQERIDARRLDYLRALWTGLTGDPEEADQVAKLLYLVVIGAGHLIPPIPKTELGVLFELTTRLAARDRAFP
ncbi:TetR/AcrR family transcriptional regulator [Actinomadura barringtoniae]|uniref:TetR/AcrR family transcriptional regulator n=1 Tax=Actinomadura barringtoniae TaxID=1427535 RepID=A0A939P8T5_9ACTN|nr:TetR/AcrR family transcriptional regulator [Actinomadura barringtoniae]MBO2447527.1 TetR/AcrR family transcriptional regulator [Actinomadura barringtoniae]